MIIEKLNQELKKAVLKAGFPESSLEILPTTNEKFGDYFSPISLKIAQNLKNQSSMEIAKEIVSKFEKTQEFFSVEAASNGLINFRLTPAYFQAETQKILEGKGEYGKSDIGKEKKARVEFVSANPTGPLHIGNARGGPLGDTIANVLEFCGYHVMREYINNNTGTQVTELGKTLASKAGLITNNGHKLTYKGDYTSDLAEQVKSEIGDTKELDTDQIIEKAGKIGADLMYKDILNVASDMGIKFENVVHESELQRKLPNILEELKKDNVLENKDGAVWFSQKGRDSSELGAVVIKSDGSYTYFASDIAYHKEKFESGFDLVVDVFGSNTSGHVPKILALADIFGYKRDNLKIILYQFVRVKRGNDIVRMSKRAGDFVTAKEVLSEVGKDAFRFTLLQYDPNTHMDFDLDRVTTRSHENPVYYVQYAHARCNSILKKAQKEGFETENFIKQDLSLLNLDSEVNLMRQLRKFPDLVSSIATSENFPVHLLAVYVLKLADLLSGYYEKERVISSDKDKSEARLALIYAVKEVLRSSLQLMGVSAPERMDK